MTLVFCAVRGFMDSNMSVTTLLFLVVCLMLIGKAVIRIVDNYRLISGIGLLENAKSELRI